MLNKEQCMKALSELSEYAEKGREYHGARGQSVDTYVDERVTLIADIICDYFSNPPLKFEELKVGMWIWDDKHHTYILIDRIWESYNKAIYFYAIGWECCENTEFEPNRFYRKEVQE